MFIVSSSMRNSISLCDHGRQTANRWNLKAQWIEIESPFRPIWRGEGLCKGIHHTWMHPRVRTAKWKWLSKNTLLDIFTSTTNYQVIMSTSQLRINQSHTLPQADWGLFICSVVNPTFCNFSSSWALPQVQFLQAFLVLPTSQSPTEPKQVNCKFTGIAEETR